MIWKTKSQAGLGHVLGLLLLAAVIGVLAFVGWRVMDQNKKTPVKVYTPTSSSSASSTYQSTADLKSAEKTLDSTSTTDPNTLNKDIQNLY